VAAIKLPEALHQQLVLFRQPYILCEMLLRIVHVPTIFQNVVENGMFLVIRSRGLDESLPDVSEITIRSRRV
jgi:hypothetical protein